MRRQTGSKPRKIQEVSLLEKDFRLERRFFQQVFDPKHAAKGKGHLGVKKA